MRLSGAPPAPAAGPAPAPEPTPGEVLLTPEQEEAVRFPLTPLLIVAGAGSGKTTVMARRILHLVSTGAAPPHEMLGLTFTNKAARHLKEQVRAVLGADADVTVATYHSFAASLVADHALELGLDGAARVLNRAQSWQLLFAVFDEFRFERRRTLAPHLLLNDALTLASRCADHLVPLEAVVADCRSVAEGGRWKPMREAAVARGELCQVVAAYERRKRERNLIDFGDQVALAVRLVVEHPEVADAHRQQHPVVLLDEYQDTNFAQRRLLQLLYPSPPGSGGPAVTAVGDDMQSIYGFRGAHLANILRFPEHFAPVQARPLQTTFRFGPALVKLAGRIQAQVAEALTKELRPAPGAANTVIECFLAADDAEEAATIADDVARGGRPWADTAILCRKRRLMKPIVAALEERGVPVEVVGDSGLLDRPEVVDLVAWLEVLADLSSVALLRILQGPRYRIGLRDLAALARHARAQRATAAAADLDPADLDPGDLDPADLDPGDLGPGGLGPGDLDAGGLGPGDLDPGGLGPRAAGRSVPFGLGDALDDLDGVAGLSDTARARLRAFCTERRLLADAALRQPVLDVAETVILRAGLWHAAGAIGRENLLRFLDLAQRFAPVEGEPGLHAFLEYLHLLDESEEDLAEAHASDSDSVKVMTIHQAKGLEFATVHVPGLAGSRGPSRIFPDNRAGENALTNSSALPWWLREDDDAIPHPSRATHAEIDDVIRTRRRDEEWRLLYVACTRARRRLVCSAAHWYRGAAEPQGPSSFYEFLAAQTDLVTERFRHDAATIAPDVAAKESHRAQTGDRYRGWVRPGTAPPHQAPVAAPVPVQLQLGELVPPQPPPPASPAPHTLSVTGLVCYSRCPKQFYWTVVRPLPRRSSAAARVGVQVHRWIEQRTRRQLALIEPAGQLGADEDADQAIPAPSGPGGPGGRGGPGGPGGSADVGHPDPVATAVAKLKASFLAGPLAALDPLRVEAPFVVALGRHLVRGRVDAVYERDGRVELVDFKTGRPTGPGDRGAGVQLDLYGLAALDTWGVEPDRLRTTYCYLGVDEPARLVSVDWTAATVGEVRASLATTLDALARSQFAPTPGGWCRGCDFLSVCPAGQRAYSPEPGSPW